jgi:hypothetical protein
MGAKIAVFLHIQKIVWAIRQQRNAYQTPMFGIMLIKYLILESCYNALFISILAIGKMSIFHSIHIQGFSIKKMKAYVRSAQTFEKSPQLKPKLIKTYLEFQLNRQKNLKKEIIFYK